MIFQTDFKNLAVSGEHIKAKVKSINEHFKEKNALNASYGWRKKFKRRIGIRLKNIRWKKLPPNVELVGLLKNELRAIMTHDSTHKQISNADETVLSLETTFFQNWSEKTKKLHRAGKRFLRSTRKERRNFYCVKFQIDFV